MNKDNSFLIQMLVVFTGLSGDNLFKLYLRNSLGNQQNIYLSFYVVVNPFIAASVCVLALAKPTEAAWLEEDLRP